MHIHTYCMYTHMYVLNTEFNLHCFTICLTICCFYQLQESVTHL